jgi:hypothetical protein
MNKPAIYPASAAELYREETGKAYQPSNGMEGSVFMENWCFKCRRWDLETGCPIQDATMLHGVDEPGYPKEWRIGDDGQPECAAFDNEAVPAKDERQIDLFEATP